MAATQRKSFWQAFRLLTESTLFGSSKDWEGMAKTSLTDRMRDTWETKYGNYDRKLNGFSIEF